MMGPDRLGEVDKMSTAASFEVWGPAGQIVMLDDRREVIERDVDLATYRSLQMDIMPKDRIPRDYVKFLCDESAFPSIADTQAEPGPSRLPPEAEAALSSKALSCLFPFQRHAICQMVRHRRCVNATSMGCGKTIQAICALAILRERRRADGGGAAAEAEKPDLVLCPGYLRDNWAKEAALWLPAEVALANTHVVSSACSKKRSLSETLHWVLYGAGIKIISYDMAANLFSHLTAGQRKRVQFFNTVVCDESHYLKESKTKRFQVLNEVIKNADAVFLLSGTPAPNRPVELFSQLHLLYPQVFADSRCFTKRYCAGHVDFFGFYNDRGQSCVEELAFLTSKLMIRIRREDVLEDLPSVMRARIDLPCKPSAAYRRLASEFTKQLGLLDKERGAQFKVQTLASQMFLETSRVKRKPVEEYLRDLVLGQGRSGLEKTIIFCKHRDMLEHIRQHVLEKHLPAMGLNYIAVSGETDTAMRAEHIKHFLRSEDCRIALLTIGSCATGLNMTPVAHMIFAELTWCPSDLAQCEARISRIGGASHLNYTYLVCENTIDDKVFGKLSRKTELISQIVDQGKDYGDFGFASKRKKT